MKNKLFVFFIVLLLGNCSNDGSMNFKYLQTDSLYQDEYQDWVNNNESLVREKEIGELTFLCRYIPIDLLIANNNLDDSSLIRKELELGRDSICFFRISISPKKSSVESIFSLFGKSGMNESDFFNYLNFEYGNHIKLITVNDTISCGTYIFERSYNLSRSLTMLVGFSGKDIKNKQSKTVIIDDNLFESGIMHFKFPSEIFENNPKLKTKL